MRVLGNLDIVLVGIRFKGLRVYGPLGLGCLATYNSCRFRVQGV